jgi:hypothetical protein
MRKKNLITFFSLFAISGSLISPAKSHYNRTSFGEGTAAFACFLLWEGYPKYQVESLISRFAERIEKSTFTEKEMNQMAYGYRDQIRVTSNCDLRMRY